MLAIITTENDKPFALCIVYIETTPFFLFSYEKGASSASASEMILGAINSKKVSADINVDSIALKAIDFSFDKFDIACYPLLFI